MALKNLKAIIFIYYMGDMCDRMCIKSMRFITIYEP